MDQTTFLTNLEELFESAPGSLSLDQILTDTGKWDSLNFVSFLALAHSKYGVKVEPTDLRTCQTVGDLLKLVKPQ